MLSSYVVDVGSDAYLISQINILSRLCYNILCLSSLAKTLLVWHFTSFMMWLMCQIINKTRSEQRTKNYIQERWPLLGSQFMPKWMEVVTMDFYFAVFSEFLLLFPRKQNLGNIIIFAWNFVNFFVFLSIKIFLANFKF
jgi:hypothetical protein